MEFTKLLKYASASLFLVLLIHGLILGFSIPTTIISIALLAVCFLMEQKLLLSEREELNTKFIEILTARDKVISEQQTKNEEQIAEILKKMDATHSQITTLKTAQGMTSAIRRNS